MRMRSNQAALSALGVALAWTPLLAMLTVLAVSTLLVPQPARAQGVAPPLAMVAARDPAAALIDAAERGDTAPLERALSDPATSPALRILLRAELAATRLDPEAGRDQALRRLAEGRDPALRRNALRIITSAAFAQGDYAEAARSGRILAEALAAAGLAEEAAATERVWRLAALLVRHGRPGVEGPVRPGTVPTRRDRVGLTRLDFKVNGQAQEAVFDTGANLSVLSASTARRLGVTVEEGETAIGNGVQGTVPTRIGVAARVEIAGTILTNVPFLILDDANLNFPQVPGGYSIPAIIGIPEMRALGRVRMEQAGRFTVLPPVAEGEAGPANLHAGGNNLFADVSVDGRLVPLHLDTGADRTNLSALYAAAEPARLQALRTSQANFSSAGGTRVRRFATWPNAPMAVGGRNLTLPELTIELPGSGPDPDDNGTLGSDVLRRFESYTLDFGAMRLSLGAPVTAR